ncbi:MAG: hypothetical protein KME08_01300 [Aphanothece sp. CMT-3BRIN-NPC111]|jgi:hypothetical protein|nr:hypothetical protein [Aphanothece sp. CMT-3BRIN-NPC111]
MTRKDDEVLEQIAQLIESLPSECLLQRCWTEDQIKEWHRARKTQVLLAEGWRALFINGYGDPILEALDKKEISQHKYDLMVCILSHDQAQWELVLLGDKYVRQFHSFLQNLSKFVDSFPKPLKHIWHKFFQRISLKEYPFISPYDLFAETLREQIDGSFSWCLEPYYDVPVKKWGAATKQLSQIFEKGIHDGIYPQPNLIEVAKLKSKLVWHKVGFSWMAITIVACQMAARNDPSLRRKLVAYNKSIQGCFKLAATVSRKIHGFAWVNGQEIPASNTGGIYAKP